MNHFGATPQEWSTMRGLGIDEDLLPVVSSDPSLSISPASSLKAIGKVPSIVNSRGQVVGFPGWQEHQATAAQLEQWQRDPRLGISVATRSLRAIDIDVEDESQAKAIVDFVSRALNVCLPCRYRSNSGKRLLVLRVDGNIPKRIINTPHGRIEFLGNGQQFVAAGTHPSGVRYEWDCDGQMSVPTVSAEAYEDLFNCMHREFSGGKTQPTKPKSKLHLEGGVVELDCAFPWRSGRGMEPVMAGYVLSLLKEALPYLPEEIADGYDSWINVGFAFKSLEPSCTPEESADLIDLWHEFSAKSAAYDAAESDQKWKGFGPTGMSFHHIFRIAHKNGWRHGIDREFKITDLTDANNLAILADLADGDLRFISEERCWMYWDGKQWRRDPQGSFAQALALRVADVYQDALTNMSTAMDGDEKVEQALRKGLTQWFRHCLSRRGVDDLLRLAMSDDRFLISVDKLDNHPFLLGVANGVVDLATAQLRQAARCDFITKYSPVPYVPGASRERWERFIQEITGVQDPDTGCIEWRVALANYLQRMIGYCLTGSTREQKMFVAVGEGANGKSVLFDMIARIFPNAAMTVPPELMMVNAGIVDPERASPVMASLQGVRMAISSESRVGQKLDVALIKRHTGGGRIQARRMRENSTTFEMTHKLVMMTNHQPSVDHLDEAFKGRLHIIPFAVRWNRPGSPNKNLCLPDGDKDLMAKLMDELVGILAWCIEGARMYLEQGLEAPMEVLEATRNYLIEEDHVGVWLGTCQTCSDPKAGTMAQPLLENFNTWLAVNQTGRSMSPRQFAQALASKGVLKCTVRDGVKYGLLAPAIISNTF